MKHILTSSGLSESFYVDSAGTAAYHTGAKPDPRSTLHAARRGVELSGQARQFLRGDWERFDLVCAMDRANFQDLSELADAPTIHSKLRLFRSFEGNPQSNTPDPYYGGDAGFEEVLDICIRGCVGILDEMTSQDEKLRERWLDSREQWLDLGVWGKPKS